MNCSQNGTSSFSCDSGPIPSSCCQNILSYLKLQDCVHVAAASSDLLKETMPTLLERQHRMKLPFAVITAPKYRLCSSPTSVAFEDQAAVLAAGRGRRNTDHAGKVALLEDLRRNYPDANEFTVFPTVQNRVDLLSKSMPKSHPLHGDVIKLKDALLVNILKTDVLDFRGECMASLIETLKSVMFPLKLHCKILKESLVSPEPPDQSSTDLPKYVGDVLCAAHLLLHNTSCRTISCAEGSPSQFDVAQYHLQRSTPSCYRSWVLMHAGILRTKQTVGNNEFQLDASVVGRSDYGDETSLCYSSEAEQYHRSAASWCLPLDCYRHDAFMSSELTLIYDDFGPLGPSFRGRDIVRIRGVSAHCMLACFISGQNDGPSSVALEWMRVAHEQSSKTRPMTVRVPIVRLSKAEQESS